MNCASTDLNHPAGGADQKRGSVTEAMLSAVAAAGGSAPLAAGCSLLMITEGFGTVKIQYPQKKLPHRKKTRHFFSTGNSKCDSFF
jgi:hypothetical protein